MKKPIKYKLLRYITFLLSLFIFTIGINAQSYKISGMIKSKSSNPVEYATVRLINNDSIFIDGGVSDSEGMFTVEFIKKDNYHLIISCVGFQNKLIALNNIENSTNIGSIVVDSISTQLEEVVVRGSSQIRKEDKILIFPTKLEQKHAANGFELLNNLMIPQIDIEQLTKTITIRGKNVLLAINGRPVKSKEEIIMLRPQDVMRVEYHDLPKGFYAGNEAVIDYITHQYEVGGYFGVNGTQNLTYTGGNYLATARVNYQKSEFSVGYYYDYLTDRNIRNKIDELFVYPDSDLKRSEIGAPSIKKIKHIRFLLITIKQMMLTVLICS